MEALELEFKLVIPRELLNQEETDTDIANGILEELRIYYYPELQEGMQLKLGSVAPIEL